MTNILTGIAILLLFFGIPADFNPLFNALLNSIFEHADAGTALILVAAYMLAWIMSLATLGFFIEKSSERKI